MSTPKSPENMTEKVLDWFERNPTAKTRCGPLSKALKADAGHLATTLNNLATRGQLGRVRVKVGKDEGGTGGEQWEYFMPTGGFIAPAPKPYQPPKAFRRDTSPVAAAPAAPAATQVASQIEAATSATHEELAAARAEADTIKVDMAQKLADCTAQLQAAEQQRDAHFDTAQEYKSQLDIAERAVEAWIGLARDFGCETLAELREKLNTKSNAPAAAPIGYLVRVPKRKPRLLTKQETAIACAKAAAKAVGRADVLALVPAGTARRRAAVNVEFN
jgi:hypothetical protein